CRSGRRRRASTPVTRTTDGGSEVERYGSSSSSRTFVSSHTDAPSAMSPHPGIRWTAHVRRRWDLRSMAPRMHDDEIDSDVHLVRHLLEAQQPQWAHLPIQHVSSTGTDNAMYRLGKDMVVRLPLRPS